MKLFKSADRYYCTIPSKINKGVKSKTFKDIDDCLEYAMCLPNMSISDSILHYIRTNKHPILTRKDFCMC